MFAPTPANDPYALGNHTENNQNLRLGAGVRLVGAAASTIHETNITDNAFGVLNTTLDGTTANRTKPVDATERLVGPAHRRGHAPDAGPGRVERPGQPGDDAEPAGAGEPGQRDAGRRHLVRRRRRAGLDAVIFCPYRSSDQADSVGGEFPVAETTSTARPAVVHEQRPL